MITAVVDFGSSHTVTVVHVPGEPPRVVPVDGEPWLPSAVFLSPDDSLVVGVDALRMGAAAPDRLETRAKSRVGAREVLLGDTVLPVTAVVRAVLSRAVRAAAAVAGAPVEHLVLTHPADWGVGQLRGLLGAAAGVAPSVSTIAEPVGAGVWFATRGELGVDGADRFPLGAVLAVVDVGGGTTDVAVVRREAAGVVVVARDAIPDLGGGDFDQRIVDYLRATVPGLADRLVDATGDTRVSLVQLRELVAFRREVRRAKELLSRHEQVELALPGRLPPVVLTRADLEAVLFADLDRITAFAMRVIVSAVEPGELLAVQLAGGSTRIPALARSLAEVLPAPVARDDQPEALSALGACAVAVSHEPVEEEPAAPPPPVAERNRPRAAVLALVAVALLAIAGVGYGLLTPAEVVGGTSAAASERVTLPAAAGGAPLARDGAPADGLVTGRVGVPVRMYDGVTDIDWTVNGIRDPATDEMVAAGALKPGATARWVILDTTLTARRDVGAPYYLGDTYLVDDRGLMIAPVRDAPMPKSCPRESPAALFSGQRARQCLAFAVSWLTPVRAAVISKVVNGAQVGVVVPVDAPEPPIAAQRGRPLQLGVVRPLRVGGVELRVAVVDVVTNPSAYVDLAVVDRPGSRAVVVRASVDAAGQVSVPELVSRLMLHDDRYQPVPARLLSDREGCATGTASGQFTVCAVFVVPKAMPLAEVGWAGDDARPFLWRLR